MGVGDTQGSQLRGWLVSQERAGVRGELQVTRMSGRPIFWGTLTRQDIVTSWVWEGCLGWWGGWKGCVQWYPAP